MAERPDQDDDLNGYERHWFIKKETVQNYRCDKCSNILKDPRQIAICGDRVCASCLPGEMKECPSCKREVKSQNEIFSDVAVEKKIFALEMKCPAKPCKWRGTLKEFLQKHKNECPSKLVKCRNEECKELVARDELDKHLENECQYRKIECRYCEQPITVAAEKDHCEKDCLRAPVPCARNCGMEIPKEEVENHVKDCEGTIIECKFKGIGCGKEVERGKMREHEEQEVHDHLSQAAQVIVLLEQQKQEMSEEIKQLRDANDNLQKELRDFNEKEEARVQEIDLELKEFKEQGTVRLEGVQKATEQNYENLALAVAKNGEFQEMLFRTQDVLNQLQNAIIPEIQNACLLHQAGNKKLTENHEKLYKMIVAVHNKLKSELASVQKEKDTQINALFQEHEMERTARLNHEAKCAEENSKLYEAIADNSNRLESTEVALTVTQDEMKDGFSEHCKQMQLDYDNLSHLIKKEKQSRENDMVQITEEMSQLRSISTGKLIWKVSNVEASISRASVVQSKAKALLGQAFYTEPYGYLLQPKIFFNGVRLNDQAYISVFIQIVKGPFDPVLKWPFEKRIRITLIEQESGGLRRNIEKVLMPAADGEEVQRPCNDANNGFGIYKFVSHEELRAGRYMLDDAVFVKLEVLEDHDGHNETI